MTQPLPHQQRVIEERAELDKKVEALTAFINDNPVFKGLAREERDLLRLQLWSMVMYSNALGKRLALWGLAP